VRFSAIPGILWLFFMPPNEIKDILAGLGAKPNKALGQHFLIDQAALDDIVSAADIHAGDIVLEVGPGLGVLTARLLDAGADVRAIEQDRLFIPYLEQRFSGKSLAVTHGDAAAVHWHELVDVPNWKLISNLPYSITSLALRKALYAPHPAERVVVLIQREVAERVVARTGKTSLLSLMVGLASSSARIVRRVPPGAFFPPPRVDSAVLEIQPLTPADRMEKWGMDPEKIMEVARAGFAHPRKLLASNLKVAGYGHGMRGTLDIGTLFESLGINPKARAEDLTPEQWAKVAEALK
jgi:16S rRNA (adenine1518-N6/adenine1519-N6)-dimethyltransferase